MIFIYLKLLIASSIPNSRLDFEIPFDLVTLCQVTIQFAASLKLWSSRYLTTDKDPGFGKKLEISVIFLWLSQDVWTLKLLFHTKSFIEVAQGAILWNRIWDLGWLWAGLLATPKFSFLPIMSNFWGLLFMFSWTKENVKFSF